jgi:TonB family protein
VAIAYLVLVRSMKLRTVLLLHFVTLPFYVDVAGAQSTPPQKIPPRRKGAIFAPRPAYPYEARKHHITGAGVCIVSVRPDGTISHAEMRPSTGHAILDNAALDAFRRWRFFPGSTAPKVKIPIRYSMKGASY